MFSSISGADCAIASEITALAHGVPAESAKADQGRQRKYSIQTIRVSMITLFELEFFDRHFAICNIFGVPPAVFQGC